MFKIVRVCRRCISFNPQTVIISQYSPPKEYKEIVEDISKEQKQEKENEYPKILEEILISNYS